MDGSKCPLGMHLSTTQKPFYIFLMKTHFCLYIFLWVLFLPHTLYNNVHVQGEEKDQ